MTEVSLAEVDYAEIGVGEVGMAKVYSTKRHSLPLVSFPCTVRFEECVSTEVVANKIRLKDLALPPLVPSSNTFLQPLDMLRVGHWPILPFRSTCASGYWQSFMTAHAPGAGERLPIHSIGRPRLAVNQRHHPCVRDDKLLTQLPNKAIAPQRIFRHHRSRGLPVLDIPKHPRQFPSLDGWRRCLTVVQGVYISFWTQAI